jgi:ribulose-5-phosphate 4-epimerase/fuculose-1-phosphate aldolase
MPITMSHHAPIQRHIPMTEAEQAARVQLAACYHVFAHLGWVESIFNHITLRVPGPEKIFLINPFGRLYREVTASNLVAIDIDGNPVRATEYPVNRAGFVIHSAIHAHVDQAHCVMHTHTVSGMAVSCLAEGLMHDSFNGAQLKGRVAYHDFEGVTVRPDEQTRLLASIGDKKAVILRNHGLLAWGGSLPEAFGVMYSLQRACDTQIAASAAGSINRISTAAMEQSRQEFIANEPRACQLLFDAMVRQLDLPAIDYRS